MIYSRQWGYDENLNILGCWSEMYDDMVEEAYRRFYEISAEAAKEEGRVEGRVEGRAEGEELVINLLAKLSSLGKNEDVSKCIMDPEYREKMYIAYGFKKERDNNLM